MFRSIFGVVSALSDFRWVLRSKVGIVVLAWRLLSLYHLLDYIISIEHFVHYQTSYIVSSTLRLSIVVMI